MLFTWTKTVIWLVKGYSMETTLDHLKSLAYVQNFKQQGKEF